MDSLTEIYTLDFHNPHPSIELYLFEHLSKYKGIVTTNSKLEQQDNGQQWTTIRGATCISDAVFNNI